MNSADESRLGATSPNAAGLRHPLALRPRRSAPSPTQRTADRYRCIIFLNVLSSSGGPKPLLDIICQHGWLRHPLCATASNGMERDGLKALRPRRRPAGDPSPWSSFVRRFDSWYEMVFASSSLRLLFAPNVAANRRRRLKWVEDAGFQTGSRKVLRLILASVEKKAALINSSRTR